MLFCHFVLSFYSDVVLLVKRKETLMQRTHVYVEK